MAGAAWCSARWTRPGCCRRWPRPGARLQLVLRVGERLDRPSDLEHFLTARWGLHTAWYGGRVRYLQNEHPRWPLYQAALVHLEEDLLAAAGLPSPAGEPASVLYSPGVAVRMGAPGPASGEGRLDPAHRLRDLAEAVSARLDGRFGRLGA